MMNRKRIALFVLSLATLNGFSQDQSANKISLPQPTESHRKNSKVIGWPEGKIPTAPQGFTVSKFADKSSGLDNPRWMYITPNGDVLVSQSRTNKKTSPNNILLFRDADKNGSYETSQVFMSGLNQPLGMLVQGAYFHVGNTDGGYRKKSYAGSSGNKG